MMPLPEAGRSTEVAASPPGDDKLASAARDFETMAIGEFLQPMFSTVDDTNNPFDGGQAEGILKPMLVSEFAKIMEKKGGFGLEAVIEQKMAELERTKDSPR